MIRTVAGIVLYRPDMEQLERNIDAIIDQVDRLALVDNGSENIRDVEERYSNHPKIDIMKNRENLGIAAALNQIMRWGKSQGYEWVLTLDQDSVAMPDMVSIMSEYAYPKKVGIVCPSLLFPEFPNRKARKDDAIYRTVELCVTSGSLTNIAAVEQVGGFDEKMFIDEVDHDMCIRLRLAGYQLIRAVKAQLRHSVGNITEVFVFPRLAKLLKLKSLMKPMYPFNHSNIRKYYIVRNNIYVHRKYKGKVDLKSKKKSFHRAVRSWFLAEHVTWGAVKATLKGFWDGYRMPVK